MFNNEEQNNARDFMEHFNSRDDDDPVNHCEYELATLIVTNNDDGHLDEFVDDCFQKLAKLTGDDSYYPYWLHVADDDADIAHCADSNGEFINDF